MIFPPRKQTRPENKPAPIDAASRYKRPAPPGELMGALFGQHSQKREQGGFNRLGEA
jgi:hypothetical protein